MADASKTSVGNVQIIQYTEVPPKVGGGARRRLLGVLLGDGYVPVQEGGVKVEDGLGIAGGEMVGVGMERVIGDGIHVFLEVSGGEGDDLEGLDAHLIGVGLEPSLDHAWYSPHSVSVRKA